MDLFGVFGKAPRKPSSHKRKESQDKKPEKEHWRDELSKARKYILIRVINQTRRTFLYKEKETKLSGKWSSGHSYGSIDDSESKGSSKHRDKEYAPPHKIETLAWVEFGAMSSTMLSGITGVLVYGAADRKEKASLCFNLPKIGKEKVESIEELPFYVEIEDKLSTNQVTFTLREKRSDEDLMTYGLLSSSIDFDLRNSTELRVQEEFKKNQIVAVERLTKEEFFSEVTSLRFSLCDPYNDDPTTFLDILDRYLEFALKKTDTMKEGVDVLIKEHLPEIVKSLLSKKTRDYKTRKTIQKFFSRVLDLCFSLLSPDYPSLIVMTKQILDDDRIFYQYGERAA